jgi:hypothetical protein
MALHSLGTPLLWEYNHVYTASAENYYFSCFFQWRYYSAGITKRKMNEKIGIFLKNEKKKLVLFCGG